jgi:diketogulonate reductase-like aldo/keto reductase
MTSRFLASAMTPARVFELNKPVLVYGTAWKKDLTAKYVQEAIQAGFRFVDTACQPRHYNEPGVGQGWKAAADKLGLKRSDIFLQTKYTSEGGQDPKTIPYDPRLPIEDQVKASIKVSLQNLQTDYIDSLILHSPFQRMEDTMAAWRTMERFVDDGTVHRIGISNIYDPVAFKTLYEMARIKPWIVQNRFYAESNFDTELRAFCKQNGVKYQSFWTLTANRHALATREANEWADKVGLSPQTLMYSFLMSLGYIWPLSGTTSPQHMAEDVAVMERMQNNEAFFKSSDDLRQFAQLLGMPDM